MKNDNVLCVCYGNNYKITFYFSRHSGEVNLLWHIHTKSLWQHIKFVFKYALRSNKISDEYFNKVTFSTDDVSSLATFFNHVRSENFARYPEMTAGMEKD